MFCHDFLQTALPVRVEPKFFTSVLVELVQNGVHRLPESRLKRVVELVACLDDLLVVRRVLHRDLCVNFVFFHLRLLEGALRSWISWRRCLIPVRLVTVHVWLQPHQVDLEDWGA